MNDGLEQKAKDNIIVDKSYQFALSIVKLYKELNGEKEYVISKQLLSVVLLSVQTLMSQFLLFQKKTLFTNLAYL